MLDEMVEGKINSHSSKYKHKIKKLEVGQEVMIPYSHIKPNLTDPTSTLRSIAYIYGRKWNRKFGTRKDYLGVWIIRKA